MKPGFQQRSLKIETNDGADDVLLDPLTFVCRNGVIYRAPIGSTTDGLSTPKIVRILPGYDSTGDDWLSGVLHDAAYRNFLEVRCSNRLADGVWRQAKLTQKECDTMILEAMKSQGVGLIRRHIIYCALRLFGRFAFASDRKTS